MTIQIINGPNLNLLGNREKEIYGHQSFDSYFQQLQKEFKNIELNYFQSNHEGAIIDKIQEAGSNSKGIIINAGAYTHTSIGIADAIATISTPVIEVHISNVHAREEYRTHSKMAKNCKGVITGFQLNSYKLALQYFADNN